MGARIIGICAALALATGAFAQDAKWGQALAEFQKNAGSRVSSERASAAKALGDARSDKTDKHMVSLIMGLLQSELARDKGGKEEDKVSGAVLDACEKALRAVTNEKAVDEIAAAARTKNPNTRLRAIALRVLGAKKLHLAMLQEMVNDKDLKIQIAAIDGLVASVTAKDEALLPLFLRILAPPPSSDPKKPAPDFGWECKWAALTGITAIGVNNDALVDGLITGLERCPPAEGRIKVRIIEILGECLGIADPKTEDPDWWRQAKKNKDTPPAPGHTTIEATEFFGLKTKSSRLVFVLDRTGSMQDTVTIAPPEKKNPPADPPPAPTPTGNRPPPQQPNAPKPTPQDEAMKAKCDEIRKKYEGKPEMTKMDALKREFMKTIYHLDPKVEFTVVWYETSPQYWKPQLMLATWPNKFDCIQEVDRLGPTGGTDIFCGLEAALKLVEHPSRPGVVEADKKAVTTGGSGGADTFFLMTDGNHNNGKFVDQTSSPAGPHVADFIGEVKKIYAVRKVLINVVALGDLNKGADPLDAKSLSFLKQIAQETGGSFAHIGKGQ